jgi:hypothetical protein
MEYIYYLVYYSPDTLRSTFEQRLGKKTRESIERSPRRGLLVRSRESNNRGKKKERSEERLMSPFHFLDIASSRGRLTTVLSRVSFAFRSLSRGRKTRARARSTVESLSQRSQSRDRAIG